MESLILFGGSFNPVHNGHLRIARAASLRMNAEVIFVPNAKPRWKNPEVSAADRLAMLEAAIKADGSPAFSISKVELDEKPDVHYWVDTLRFFKKKYPKMHLYFLIGADSVNTFPEWEKPDECAALATPLYVSRPGIELDDAILAKYHMQRLDYDGAGSVSSSQVRSLQSADIPIVVREYIEKHGLYYMAELKKLIGAKRLAHSVSVAVLSYHIAVKSRLDDPQGAYIAGLLHDCGKNVPNEEAKAILEEEFPELADKMPEWTYHQFAGARIAKEKFGIQDEAILTAIRYHATGRAHMPP
ncbi:MAG: nicotinate (nicotinamide) nucleotide adenylyltransferase, partial [Bacilli bacterium]|nr:nicotinate (nicotinamide) nucleotide adenylyltransferase [Bacilli bacterium]